MDRAQDPAASRMVHRVLRYTHSLNRIFFI